MGCTCSIPEAPTIAALFGIGLAIALGHCVGMCGPLLSVVAVSQRKRGGGWGLATRQASYHTGRIAVYAVIGAIVGALHVTVESIDVAGARLAAGVSILAGVLAAALALSMIGAVRLPAVRFPGSRRLSPAAHFKDLAGGGTARQFALGAANGMLPCGPVLATALAAGSSASVGGGALGMTAFGVGTLPVTVLVGLGAYRLSIAFRTRMYRIGAALLLIVSLQLLLRGASALGWVPHARIGEVVLW